MLLSAARQTFKTFNESDTILLKPGVRILKIETYNNISGIEICYWLNLVLDIITDLRKSIKKKAVDGQF